MTPLASPEKPTIVRIGGFPPRDFIEEGLQMVQVAIG